MQLQIQELKERNSKVEQRPIKNRILSKDDDGVFDLCQTDTVENDLITTERSLNPNN